MGGQERRSNERDGVREGSAIGAPEVARWAAEQGGVENLREEVGVGNEVETAVEIAEEIVEAVEKASEGVEKVAEKLAEELPEGGGLKKAVDFVEHVAEIANKDAHKLGDLIDKVN
ncbi:hypothetical protein SASPL_148348 [Salvia splendens]|uniref:Uncharacterized protein n=1 Tax=Salvia splendens TaxID=180675 RepID=A0A8X8W9K3_SALSN|nr:hypothetical protein SASPL_148348 [Salvia splendens]